MKNDKSIETKLRSAVSHAVPDALDDILSAWPKRLLAAAELYSFRTLQVSADCETIPLHAARSPAFPFRPPESASCAQ